MYHYEVLRARYEIRDFFLSTIVREVYENIGQSLSLAGLQIASLEQATGKSDHAMTTGNLIGQSIKNLRELCRRFYPDEDILKEKGFSSALDQVIRMLFPESVSPLRTEGKIKDPEPGLQLICFKMLLDMLISIKEQQGFYMGTVITYQPNTLSIELSYRGENILEDSYSGNEYLSLDERTLLIRGKCLQQTSPEGVTKITLSIPLKHSAYEASNKDRPG